MVDVHHRVEESMDELEDENEPADENIPPKKIVTAEENFVLSFLNNENSQLYKWAIISIVVCFLSCMMYLVLGNNQVSCTASSEDINNRLQSLKEPFRSQNVSLWAGIIAGLMNLLKNPVEPAVYLLVFDEKSKTSSSCIAEVITTLATRLLQPCEMQTRKWLLINGTALAKSSSNDPGDLVDAITREKEHSRIVVVPDVQKIPAKLAQGFHSLVDPYDTMSKKSGAVYIFTLMIPRLDYSSAITRTAEDILLANWKELDPDELQPLVTRISHFVLPVAEEYGVQLCPLKINSTVEVQIP